MFLDPARQAEYDTDGYTTLPLLEPDEVQALRDVYYGLGKAPGDPERACISTFHTYDAEYKQKISDGVHGVLKPHCDEIFDDYKCLPANFLTKWPGGMSGFGLHQDLALVDETQYTSAEIWVALEDIRDGKRPRSGSPVQLVACPRCGTMLIGERGLPEKDTYQLDTTAQRTLVWCCNQACEFSAAPAHHARDGHVHRRLPCTEKRRKASARASDPRDTLLGMHLR